MAARSGDRSKARHLLARLLLDDLNNADYYRILTVTIKEVRRRNHEKTPPHSRFEYIVNSLW